MCDTRNNWILRCAQNDESAECFGCHSDAEAFSAMLRGIASKHPVKSCNAKRDITGFFAALRMTETQNVIGSFSPTGFRTT